MTNLRTNLPAWSRLAEVSFLLQLDWTDRGGNLTLNVVPDTIRANGRKRWRIEALFKTLKSRFGLHRSGQYTKRGMLRYYCLCFLSYVLCHLENLEDADASSRIWPDWRVVAQQARRKYCGWVRLSELRKEIKMIEAVLDNVLLL